MAPPEDKLGWSVATWGDTAMVGARDDTLESKVFAGTAYVFTRVNGGWQFAGKLAVFDAEPYDRLGSSVAIHDDAILVGAIFEAEPPAYNRFGAAHVSSSSDRGQPNKDFGFNVSISGTHIAVGAPGDGWATGARQGAAYMFHRTGAGWHPQNKLQCKRAVSSPV